MVFCKNPWYVTSLAEVIMIKYDSQKTKGRKDGYVMSFNNRDSVGTGPFAKHDSHIPLLLKYTIMFK